MARYKMTVVFDVHDDEDRSELMRLQQEKKRNPEKFKGRHLRESLRGTPSERRLKALETDPLTDESYFLRSVIDRLHEIDAFPYDRVQCPCIALLSKSSFARSWKSSKGKGCR